MKAEWTTQRRQAMKRNSAIIGRNRFMAQFNAWFGTDYQPLPLEELAPLARESRSESAQVTRPQLNHNPQEGILQ